MTGQGPGWIAKSLRLSSLIAYTADAYVDIRTGGSALNYVLIAVGLAWWTMLTLVAIERTIPEVQNDLEVMTDSISWRVLQVCRWRALVAVLFAVLVLVGSPGAGIADDVCSTLTLLSYVWATYATTVFGPKKKSWVKEKVGALRGSLSPALHP